MNEADECTSRHLEHCRTLVWFTHRPFAGTLRGDAGRSRAAILRGITKVLPFCTGMGNAPDTGFLHYSGRTAAAGTVSETSLRESRLAALR